MRQVKWLILLGVFTVLCSCASVPLSTLWKAKNLTPQDLAQIKPADLRAAIQSEPEFLDISPSPILGVYFHQTDHSPKEFSFELQRLEEDLSGLPEPDAKSSWVAFRLKESEEEPFAEMQNQLLGFLNNAEDTGGGFGLNVVFEADDENPRSEDEKKASLEAVERWQKDGIPFGVAIRLYEEDGFIVIVKPTRMDFEYTDNSEE